MTVRRQGEVTESGRMCFPAKEVTAHAVRGFKSHPLRNNQMLSFNIRFGLRTLRSSNAPLAQLDRASGYGPEGRGFESLGARCTRDLPLPVVMANACRMLPKGGFSIM